MSHCLQCSYKWVNEYQYCNYELKNTIVQLAHEHHEGYKRMQWLILKMGNGVLDDISRKMTASTLALADARLQTY